MSRRSEIDYLLDYLKEAFERFPEVRIRHIPVSSSPESDDGVTVRTEAREYFFPFAWVFNRRFDEIEREVRRIQELLE